VCLLYFLLWLLAGAWGGSVMCLLGRPLPSVLARSVLVCWLGFVIVSGGVCLLAFGIAVVSAEVCLGVGGASVLATSSVLIARLWWRRSRPRRERREAAAVLDRRGDFVRRIFFGWGCRRVARRRW
jgi:hypothetical protein